MTKIERLNKIYNELQQNNTTVTSDVFYKKIIATNLKVTPTDIIEFILTKKVD